jgi:hypothetical protein
MLDIISDDIFFYIMTFLDYSSLIKLNINSNINFFFNYVLNWRIYFLQNIRSKNISLHNLFTSEFCKKSIISHDFTCFKCNKYLSYQHSIILCNCLEYYFKGKYITKNLRYCRKCIYMIKNQDFNFYQHIGNVICPLCNNIAMYFSVTFVS